MSKVKASIQNKKYITIFQTERHTFLADEPEELGGQNAGPTPMELLAASLAGCASITMKMYADRKQWPLDEAEVHVEVDNTSESGITKFKKQIIIKGDLTDEQKKRLLNIADKCPVNKALQQKIIME